MNQTIADIVSTLVWVLTIAMFIRAIMSWFPVSHTNPIYQLVHTITDPILKPLSRIVPRVGFIDLTPMVAILLLYIIQQIVISSV